MSTVNEAIVSYNQALVRPGDTQGAQVVLAKAFLMPASLSLDWRRFPKRWRSVPRTPNCFSSSAC